MKRIGEKGAERRRGGRGHEKSEERGGTGKGGRGKGSVVAGVGGKGRRDGGGVGGEGGREMIKVRGGKIIRGGESVEGVGEGGCKVGKEGGTSAYTRGCCSTKDKIVLSQQFPWLCVKK